MRASNFVTVCGHCKAELALHSRRSDRKFCSDRCKQADYRRRRKIKEKPVEALVRGNNADLIKNVASLYVTDPDLTIADVTYGKGAFWRKTPHLNVTGSDLLTVSERPYDFRNLPYDDQSFDIIVLDPPYLVWPGNHMSDDRYRNAETTKGIDYKGIRQLYQDGLQEAARVARRQVWVKCKDTVEGPRQRFLHVHLLQDAEALGLRGRDLFVLDATSRMPNNHWSTQKHARKTMSYLWVFDVVDER